MATLNQLHRFVQKIAIDHDGPLTNGEPCWLWTACQTGGQKGNRYGGVTVNYHTWLAHRWIFQAVVGALQEGMNLDHLCRRRLCVNPVHLEQVTPRVNIIRGEGVASKNAAKTTCPKNHLLSGDNLFVNSEKRRVCRTCKRERDRVNQQRYRDKKKAAA